MVHMGNGVAIESAMIGSLVGSATGGVISLFVEAEIGAESEIYGNIRETTMVTGFFCGAAGGAFVASEAMCDDSEWEEEF